ncbi:MAG: hypothetical protein ACI8W8_000809 [Rhodothermales bacterium]|jgi:hypothetical protein
MKRLLSLSLIIAFSFGSVADNSLTDAERGDGWRLLFNGTNLDGWRVDKWNPDCFKVEDGAIRCHGKPSMIYYVGEGSMMTDFHFVADVMTKKNANSGIFFHTAYQDRGWPVGHEAQINTTHRDPVKTGSVYIVAKNLKAPSKDDEWFKYEIIVRGKSIVTKVNGNTVVSYTEPASEKGSRKLSTGTIGLQAHDPGSFVLVKNIKVKPLSSPMTRAERVATRGGKWYEKMDFGPAMAQHVEANKKVILKGLSVRLGADEADTMVYDTEMMSMNSAWNGWLKIQGTAWNGRHGGHPSQMGTPMFVSNLGPGWAKGGSFEDPRSPKFGPLPRDWVKYKGHFVHGDQTVVSYSVGADHVLELPARENQGDVTAYTRTFNIPKTSEKLTLRVVNTPGRAAAILGKDSALAASAPEDQLSLKPGVNVVVDRSELDWEDLAMGAPVTKDQAQGKKVETLGGENLAPPHEKSGGKGDELPRLTDGKSAKTDNDLSNCIWYDSKACAFTLDLGSETAVSRVNTYSWHGGDRGPQRFTLSGKTEEGDWTEIAKVDSSKLGDGGKHGSAILKGKGELGTFRYLRWSMPALKHGAFFTEIDVFDSSQKLAAVRKPGAATPTGPLYVGIVGDGLTLRQPQPGQVLVDIPPGKKDLVFKVVYADAQADISAWSVGSDISALTKGGPAQWPETIAVKGSLGDAAPYATDQIPLPSDNPWSSMIKFSGFDFFADGTRLAVCTWNGDVWIASGIDQGLQNISWKRYAAGLFETLGLKIVDDVIYVTCKDQIARLHDFNGDGEADYYECFNNDIMITQNFHEFTFDLQTDQDGNFYFAKGSPVRSGGRGFETTHAHHGTVYKVAKDGQSSEVHGNGMRAPGGMGVGPNGEVTTGENEGTYVPACKISWVTKGSFSGVIHPGNSRTMEQGYDPPLCWMPMSVDNSGGGQVWVDSDKWGPFNGELLHLSYGRSTVYKVLKEEVDGTTQGGVVKLPIKLASSAMRGRFNPVDKQLYVSGFRGWQTNAAKESAIQRIRYTGAPVAVPSGLRVTKKGIYLSFTQALEKELAEDIESYDIKYWNYLWSPQYGSGHFSVDNPDEDAIALAMTKESHAGGTRGGSVGKSKFLGDPAPVTKATLQADGKTVFLEMPKIKPVMQMQISIDVETADGDEIITTVYNTIHKLGNSQE